MYSGVSAYADSGAFQMYAGTQPEHGDEVIGLMRSELDRLISDGISDDELDVAVGPDVEYAPFDRRAHRAGETPAGAAEERAALDDGPGCDAQHAIEIGTRHAQATRRLDTHRRPVRHARGEDVARAERLANLRDLCHPERQAVSRTPE